MKTALTDFLDNAQLPLRPLLDTLPCGLIIADEMGVIAYWNEGATKQFGFTKDEMVGNLVVGLLPDRFNAAQTDIMRKYSTSEQRLSTIIGNTTELYGRRKDQTEFPIQVAITEHQIAGKRCFMAVINDIEDIQATTAAKMLTTQLAIINERIAEGTPAPGKLEDVPFAKRNNTHRRPLS